MSVVQNKYESLGFFNLVRGFGMLYVIIGHSAALYLTEQPAAVSLPVFQSAGRVVGGGLMALFFMISGFCFYRRTPKKCIASQARMLLKPYYLTGLAIIVVKWLVALITGTSFREYGTKLAMTFLFGTNIVSGATLFGIPVTTVSIFWFVLALFGGWVLYNAISWIPSQKLQRICVLLCVYLGWVLTEISKIWPMALPMALLAVGYIAAGYEIRKYNLISGKLPLPLWILIWAVALVSMAFGNVDISACVWKLGLVDVAGSFCVGFILMRLYARFMNREYNGWFAKLMEYTGLNSIWIICLHAFEKAVIPWIDLKEVFPGQPALCTAICFFGRIMIIVVLFVLIFRIRKIFRCKRRPKIVITDA